MDYPEFKKAVTDLFGSHKVHTYDPCTKQTVPACIRMEWVTRGEEGGSCWGSQPEPITPEDEPDFEDLDSLLEAFAPEIKFLQYKKLMKLSTQGEHTDRGWYGNWKTYTIVSLSLRAIFDFLSENGLLVSPYETI